jgi:itaconyl-CoA hydratase
MKISSLTGKSNYFEDFQPGRVMQHYRGKTVGEMDNVQIVNMVMNTAQSHFNEDYMSRDPRKHRIVYGGVTMSIALGLAAQDTVENALAELSMTKVRFPAPVFHGDTLYAYSEVLAVDAGAGEDAGAVVFKHWGVNQEKKVVFEAERRVLIKKRASWSSP